MLGAIYNKLSSIHAQTYHEFNPSKPVIFPYAIYRLNLNGDNDDGILNGNLEIELFDNLGNDKVRVEQLCTKFCLELNKERAKNDDYIVNFQFITAKTIPQPDTTINRKFMQFKVRIYRRY